MGFSVRLTLEKNMIFITQLSSAGETGLEIFRDTFKLEISIKNWKI
jgi:hypothetical protein